MEKNQLLNCMKLTFLFLTISMLSFTAAASAQLVSITANNTKIENVLEEISQQTGLSIAYSNQVVDLNRLITINVKNTDVKNVLSQITEGTDMTYEVKNGKIYLSNRKIEVSEQQQTGHHITGKVIDTKGEPIIGANVAVKGTTNGTITDVDGKFSLKVSDNAILAISYIGYNPQNVSIGDKTSLKIILVENTTALDEVIVVAYGTQKIRSVTGAMSKLNATELSDIPASNISQKMQGKFSGVQIYQNGGEPNGGINIRIRGAASINAGNSPLIVIDGFPTTTGLESISPDEIENISVLKDAASAALYGSRAANGVILITTKSAKSGKTNIELSTYFGIEKVANTYDDLMNASEFAQYKKEYYEDSQKYEGSTTAVPECYANPSTVKDGTSWFDILTQTALTQNYNLSLTSGTDKLKSAVNLNYNTQEGVIKFSYADRYSVRANNIFKASDNVTFGLNLSGSYIKKNVLTVGGSQSSIVMSAMLMDPQLKYENDDGTYPISYSQPGMFGNANYYLVLRDRKYPAKTLRGTVSGYMDIKIIDGLKYRLSANADLSNTKQETWVPSTVSGGMFSAPPNNAYGSYYTYNYKTWLIEHMLSYDKIFAEKHTIGALVGFSAQKSENDEVTISASDYPDDEVGWFEAATTKVGSGSKGAWSMISYLARLNYDYVKKYFLSFSIRRDGCSRFGSNAKWANFPSISAGWILTEEHFMQNLNPLNYIKIRASYGKVGNNNIGNYTHIGTVSTANYVVDGTITAGRALSNIGNSDLTWETTKSYDVGLDVGFFKDRIFFTYDYYWKKTNGLLYQVDIPLSAGFSNIQSNIGEFHFWGNELSLETKNFVNKFKWNTNLNVTFARNKAVKLGTNNTPIGGKSNQGDYNRTEVGKPLGLFYGYIYDGVYMTQAEYESQPKYSTSQVGTVRMKDINGDGIIDFNDRTIIGDPNPDMTFGITNEFSWENFDASIVFAGSVGGDILDASYECTENLDGCFNVRKKVANRWRSEDNPGDGVIPRTLTGTTELFRYTNSRWIFDGSYLMCKNITLGYTIPIKANKYCKGIRVYGSAQNIFTITDYPGTNPEVSTYSSALKQGVDYTSYPTAKVVTIGFNVKF